MYIVTFIGNDIGFLWDIFTFLLNPKIFALNSICYVRFVLSVAITVVRSPSFGFDMTVLQIVIFVVIIHIYIWCG